MGPATSTAGSQYRCGWVLITLFCTATALAGELRLDNGAVIPGELVSIDSKELVWNAEKIGKITVKKADVLSLQTTQLTSLVAGSDGDAAPMQACRVQVKQGVWSADCPQHTLEAATVAALHTPPPEKQSSGKFTTALSFDRGANPSDEIKINSAARWLRPTYRHNAELSADYEKSNGTTTEDSGDANYQYDLLRAHGWYWFGRARYYRDTFEALEEIYAVGGGIGREVSPFHGLTLSLQGGPAEVYYFYGDHDGRFDAGAYMNWSAIWDTPWQGMQFSHRGELGWIFAIADAYHFQSKTGFSLPLYKGLIAELRLDYDRTGVQIDNNGNYDMEWVLALGYRW